MGLIDRVHDPVLDQRSDVVFAEFIVKGFGVIASVGNLWANLRIVFLRGR